MADSKLTHVDASGRARMVDISAKSESERSATAEGMVVMQPDTLRRIIEHDLAKGDVLGVARLAGIQGAKQTSLLIPLCHPLLTTGIEVNLHVVEPDRVKVVATVRNTGKTGPEMEALTAVSIACLTLYDMCKAVDKTMEIGDLHLIEKTGGKSGTWRRP